MTATPKQTAESANCPDAISRADMIAAIEEIVPEWARQGSLAKYNQVTIEQALAAINALPGVQRDAVTIPDEYCDGRTLHAFRDPATDEISVVPAVAVTEGWQPIEKAGIGAHLLWARRAGDPTFRIVCGWRYSRQWAIYGTGKSQDCLDIVEPTHFMPLPAAPSKE
jgi:hypothetical protein